MDHNHQQQVWEYQDGDTRVQMSVQQSSWSSQGQASTPLTPPAIQAPMMPAMPTIPAPAPHFPIMPSFQSMHHQMHSNAMAHHQSAMQHFNDVQRNMHANMLNMQQRHMTFHAMATPPMMGLPSSQASPQIGTMPRLALLPGTVQEFSSEDESASEQEHSEDDSEVELAQKQAIIQQRQAAELAQQRQTMELEQQRQARDLEQQRQAAQLQQQLLEAQQQQVAQQRAMEEQLAADRKKLDEERRAIMKQYAADQQKLNKQSAHTDDRLRKLEDKEARSRADKDAHDQEIRKLRAENGRLARQRLQDAEKHRSEMADLARQRAAQQAPVNTFDTSALEKVIREVQAQQLSKADIEAVIQERVASQLQGLAKQQDIDTAASRMSAALQKVPAGVTALQVQDVVNKELGRAVHDLSSKMVSARGQQALQGSASGMLALSGVGPQARNANMPSPGSSRALPAPVVPQRWVEDSGARSSQADDAKALIRGKGKAPMQSEQSALPMTQEALAPARIERIASNALVRKKKSDKRSSDSAIKQSSTTDLHQIDKLQQAEQHTSGALVRNKKSKSSSSRIEDEKIPQERSPALVRKSKAKETGLASGAQQSDIDIPGLPAKRDCDLPADFPDNASQISTWERAKITDSSQRMLPTIAETFAISDGLTETRRQDKMPSAVATSSLDTGLAKISKHRRVSAVPDGTLTKTVKSDKASGSGASGSLTRTGLPSGDVTMTSVTIADIPMHPSNLPMPFSVHDMTFPADFPENASQISAWERGRAASGQAALPGSATTPQLQGATTSGQDLVRSSKPKKGTR